MGLMLGNRQLAMLREMGVRVWQPATAKAAAVPAHAPGVQLERALPQPTAYQASDATDSIAARARIHSATGTIVSQPLPTSSQSDPEPQPVTNAWRIGPAQMLYGLPESKPGPHWLVLLEASSDALHSDFDFLSGDAGKLLDNMLRAAQLHTGGGVTLAPLLRVSNDDAAHSASTDLHASLPDMVGKLKPAVVLIIGRLGAQAVLQSTEPLGKLRGQVHALYGAPAIVTLEPAYLLRNPQDKAKAWEDLCLALSVVRSKT